MLFALLACALAPAGAAPLLSPNSVWVIDSSLPGGFDQFDAVASPINLALKDLRRDWYKVLGVPPTVVQEVPGAPWDGDAALVIALAPAGTAPPESFTVAASTSPAGVPLLTVTGADVRGLIYGIFHVSADFLGVDPLWWFNDVAPAYEAAGVAVPPGYAYASGAPAFSSRGAFNNDEDLSGYFASSPLGDAVYNEHWADRFCEALLRLRVNTFIPSTFAFIDERHYRVAAKRGLRLGNHHVMPLGNNVMGWPRGVAYAYRLNPTPFKAAWQALVDFSQRDAGRDMVYSLGYRGVNDEPFWNEDKGCTTVECRGATITDAIATQRATALATPVAQGGATPVFVACAFGAAARTEVPRARPKHCAHSHTP
jgi:hypothetical protein